VSELDHLDLEDLLRLTRVLRVGPVRDVGLLEAACARPMASVLGDEAYPTLGLKAAALLHSLVRNHALVDGNKRLAWLAAVVFLDLNGHTVDLDDDAAFELVMAAADGHLDVEQIAQRLVVRPS
jgi:death on curing protein